MTMSIIETAIYKDRIVRFPLKMGTSKNRNLRYIVAGICFFVIFVLSFLYEMDKTFLLDTDSTFISILRNIGQLGYIPRSVISGVLFVVAALCGQEGDKVALKFNNKMLYLWVLMNGTFILSGCFHDIQEGFLISQVAVFVAVPLFYLLWMQNDNLYDLYMIFSISIVLFTFIVAVVYIVCFPYGEVYVIGVTEDGSVIHKAIQTFETNSGRYLGMMPNPSRVAHFATPGAICSLYLFYALGGWKRWLPVLTLGLSFSWAILAMSRAAVCSIGLAVVGFVVIYFKERHNWQRLIAAILLTAVVASAGYFAVNRGEDNSNLFSKGIVAEQVMAKTDDSGFGGRFQISGDANSFFSGRLGIWMAFLKNLNFSGHDHRYYYPLRVKDPSTSSYYYFAYPHNVALDYGYRCGIMTGLLFLIIELAGVWYCAKVMFSGKRRLIRGETFAIMCILAFIIIGNIESVDHVFTRIILVLFYLALVPLFAPDKNELA